MSKILIFPKQMVYDSSYSNVIAFSSEAERDEFINNTLIDTDYKEALNNRPEVKVVLRENIRNQIEVGENFNDIKSSNYLAIQDIDGNISFHFIQSVENNGNNNKCTLEIEKDVFMNDIDMWDKFNNFKMTRGHAPIDAYLDREFDTFKQPINFTEINRIPYNGGSEVFANTPFLYVLVKAEQDQGLQKQNSVRTYVESFKVYIAPLKNVPMNIGEQEDIFNGIWKFKLDTEEGEYNPKIISFSKEIIPTSTYRLKYGIVRHSAGDNPDVYYFFSGKYFPQNLDESKVIFFGGESDEYDNMANNLNEKIYNNETLTLEDTRLGEIHGAARSDFHGIFPMTITRIDSNLYEIKTSSSNDLLNIANEEGMWYLDPVPIGVEDIHLYVVPNKDPWALGMITQPEGTPNDASDTQFILKILTEMDGVEYWNAQNLIEYINDTDNSTIITAKKSNFNPLIVNTESNSLNYDNIINIIKDGDIYKLLYVDYAFENRYKASFLPLENPLKLKGLLPYRLILENEKEFIINNLFFQTEEVEWNDTIIKRDYLEWVHYASITPEWEERIKFVKPGLIDITTEENSWSNEKEFVIGTNVWDTYKTNHPITSKLGFRIGGHLTNIIKPALMGSIFSDLAKINVPQRADQVRGSTWVYQNKALLKGGVIGVGNSISSILERSNMRNIPESVSGNGDLLGDLLFNYSNNFLIIEERPYGNEYKSIITTIHRNGLDFPQEYYVKNLLTIKRSNFNYIQSNNIFENIPLNVFNKSNEEIAIILMLFREGIRIWWNYNKYLNYEVLNEEDNI